MTDLIERCVALFEDTMRCHYEIRVPAPSCLADMASTIIPVIQAEERARLREAIAGPEAWLDSWAKHVGNCQGGYVCTCGLTLARTELSAALAQMTL